MANEPIHAKEKRSEPGRRKNAQSDPEGSAHSPEEFDALNPQKQVTETPKSASVRDR